MPELDPSDKTCAGVLSQHLHPAWRKLMLDGMTILSDTGVADLTVQRLQALQPGAQRRWGQMSVGGMLCHLNDAYVGVSALRGVASRTGSFAGRWLLRPMALHVPLQWPHGVPTPPQVDQLIGGTPSASFAEDRTRLVQSLKQFATTEMAGTAHPYFGPLTQWEWMRWGWLHADHHLRQFSA